MSRLLPRRVSRAPRILFRTLNLTEAWEEFGLEPDHIYAAALRGDVHPVARPPRDPRKSLKGQIEYPEWELRKLADDLGVEPHAIDPKKCWINDRPERLDLLAA